MKFIKCKYNDQRVNLEQIAIYYPINMAICFMMNNGKEIMWKYRINETRDSILQIIDQGFTDLQEIDLVRIEKNEG